jgi:hypothetical protein
MASLATATSAEPHLGNVHYCGKATKENVMVRTRVGVIARVLAITALLGINAVVGVRADGDCYGCPIGNICLQVALGQGMTVCIPVGDTCFLDGDTCVVN